MQNRINNKKEVMYSALYEKYREKVLKEVLNEIKESFLYWKKNKIPLDKCSYEQLCDLLDYETDPDFVETIKRNLNHYKMQKIQEVRDERNVKIHERIRAKMNQTEDKVAALLKFRVVDAQNPMKTALIKCWDPSENLLELVRDGRFIDVFKVSALPYAAEIQLFADRQTVMHPINMKNFDEKKFEKFIRKPTLLEELTIDFQPHMMEFDTVCMIIYMNEPCTNKNYQEVFAADNKMNLMSIVFYPSVLDHAYDDVLMPGEILYIRNLCYRQSFREKNSAIPESTALQDTTIFISNPSNKSFLKYLNDFKATISNKEEHLSKCMEKLKSHITIVKQKSSDERNPYKIPSYIRRLPSVKKNETNIFNFA